MSRTRFYTLKYLTTYASNWCGVRIAAEVETEKEGVVNLLCGSHVVGLGDGRDVEVLGRELGVGAHSHAASHAHLTREEKQEMNWGIKRGN